MIKNRFAYQIRIIPPNSARLSVDEINQYIPECYVFDHKLANEVRKGLFSNLELWNLMVDRVTAGCFLNIDEIFDEFYNIDASNESKSIPERELIKSVLFELLCSNDKFYNLIERVKSSENHKLYYDIFNPFNDDENFNVVVTKITIF